MASKKKEKIPKTKRGALTKKQQAFLEYYLGVSQWNATDAARRAGYSYPNVEGSRLLVNASIAAAISQRLNEISMSGREVIVRLTEQARGDMGDFITIRDEPVTRTVTRRVADLLAELRKKMQFEESYVARAEFDDTERAAHDAQVASMRRRALRYEMLLEWDADATEDVVMTFMEPHPSVDLAKAHEQDKLHLIKSFDAETGRITLHDAQAAQVHLGKHHGLFRDVVETQNVDLTKLNEEQLERLSMGEPLAKVLAS